MFFLLNSLNIHDKNILIPKPILREIQPQIYPLTFLHGNKLLSHRALAQITITPHT